MQDKKPMGAETEYGLYMHDKDPVLASVLSASFASHIFKPDYADCNHNFGTDLWLGNGARYYIDTGYHPEYATPECSNVPQLIAHIRAGDRFLERLAREERKKDGRIYMAVKNNRDYCGNTYGSHENYSINANLELNIIRRYLFSFLVTRQIYAGQGGVCGVRSNALYFEISQRAGFIEAYVSSSTTQDRPLITTRGDGESHADKQRQNIKRLHLILGDANYCDTAHLLKFGATYLLLRILEEEPDFLREIPVVGNPILVIKKVSRDLSLNKYIIQTNKGERKAIDIQREYFEQACKFFLNRGRADKHIELIINKWGFVLDRLDSETGREELLGYVDWITRKWYLDMYLEEFGLEWNDWRRKAVDFKGRKMDGASIIRIFDWYFGNVDRKRGPYYKIERGLIKQGINVRLVSDRRVNRAARKAPGDTRAALRAEMLNTLMADGYCPKAFDINWSYFSFTPRIKCGSGPKTIRIIMNHPAENKNAQWNGIKAEYF